MSVFKKSYFLPDFTHIMRKGNKKMLSLKEKKW